MNDRTASQKDHENIAAADPMEARRIQRLDRRRARRRRQRRNRIIQRGILFILLLLTAVLLLRGCLRDRSKDSGTPEAGRISSSDGTAGAVDGSTIPVGNEASGTSAISVDAVPVRKDPEVAGFFEGYAPHRTERTAAMTQTDNMQSDWAILINADSGEIVAELRGEERIVPASMTKILTLLTAVEELEEGRGAGMSEAARETGSFLEDRFTVTIDITDYAYRNGGSAAGFALDESVTVRDLLYGTILPSGADAALSLAIYTAGSHEAFVELMNRKLSELGLSETSHFTNCVGLYDDNLYTTPSDMAMILKAAVENDLCREVLSAHTYTTSSTEQHPDGIQLSNWFLRRIEDKDTHGEVRCAKTGFVKESWNCAASYQISNDGSHYLCVTAHAHSAWRAIYDHVEIYDLYTQ